MDPYVCWQDQHFAGVPDRYDEPREYEGYCQNGPISVFNDNQTSDFVDGPAVMVLEPSISGDSEVCPFALLESPMFTTQSCSNEQDFASPDYTGRSFKYNTWQNHRTGPYPAVRTKDDRRRLRTWPGPEETGYGSLSPTEQIDQKPEQDSQRRRQCSECHETFDDLRSLEEHARKKSHKAWKCSDCGNTYGLRSTFQRHRATHKDATHICFHCSRLGKDKTFKRKDHLQEHVRNCHRESSDTSSSASEISCFSDLVQKSNADHGGDGGFSESPMSSSLLSQFTSDADEEKSITKQREAMKQIVRSLSEVLGHRHQKLIGSLGTLESSMNSLSDAKIESVAEIMAEVALAKALLNRDSD